MKTIYKTVDGHLTVCPTLEKGCWVHLQNPSKEETEGLTKRFDLDPTFLPAALDIEESARLEVDNEQTLIIVDTPYTETESSGAVYSTLPLGIVLVDEVIITVSAQETALITDFTEERIRGFSTDKRLRFILQLLYRNAALFLSRLKQVDKASVLVQNKLEKSLRNQELLQMMQLEKSLVFFSTSLKGNEAVLEKMMRLESIRKNPEVGDLLDDVIIENKQAIEMCTIYRDILTGTMDAFASIISNNLNIVMKILTSLTILLSVPTLFAAFWGMNVAVPFAGSPYGFYIVLGISVLTAFLTFMLLWRKKMF